MTRWLAVLWLAACGTPAVKPGNGSVGTSATGKPPCDAARARVEQLYRASATGNDAARIDEAVADNTAMVMTDCATDPDKVAACIARATSAAELESRCVIALDDEGSEGDRRAQ